MDSIIILAAGLGKRMRVGSEKSEFDSETEKLASSGLKSMIPIKGRPFLDYVIEHVISAGFKKVCLVINPESKSIEEYYRIKTGNLKERGISIEFAYQNHPRGTADALLSAEKIVKDNEFCMINGDNLYGTEDLKKLLENKNKNCIVAYDKELLLSGSNISSERIKKFAILCSDKNHMNKIVEKPESPERYSENGKILVNMNCWKFNRKVFEACKSIKPNPERKEYELTGAVQKMIDEGEKITIIEGEEPVLDLTGREDIHSVREILKGLNLTW